MKKTICLLLLALLLAGCADTGAAEPPVSGPPAGAPAVMSAPEQVPEQELEHEPEHEHQPAEEPAVTDEPEMVYCGNTITTIVTRDGGEYSIEGDDSIALTDLLLHLVYADNFCRCMPEYTIDTEFGSGYGVNLSEAYARDGSGQVPLTSEQVELIQGIIERACA